MNKSNRFLSYIFPTVQLTSDFTTFWSTIIARVLKYFAKNVYLSVKPFSNRDQVYNKITPTSYIADWATPAKTTESNSSWNISEF